MKNQPWFVVLLSTSGVLLGAGLIILALLSLGPRSTALAAPVRPVDPAPPVAPAPARSYTPPAPGPFIAKVYTEALGRVPSQGEWQDLVTAFTTSLDCVGTVTETLYTMYTGPEFMARAYDPVARLLALYRGGLNREPDAAGLDDLARYYADHSQD